MAKRPRFRHLKGDSALLPYAARTGLRKTQRHLARGLCLAGALFLLGAGALVWRQTAQRGGQPAPPDPPAVTAAPAAPAPTHAPAAVTVRPATAGMERDVLARTEDADAEAHASPVPEASPAPAAIREVLPQYRELYEQNPDLVGWLRIEGTGIDYPVVQAAGDNEYYLRRGFDRLYATGGTLFLDARCSMGFDGAPTANWLVYGHNMADGSMFGTLARYADEGFWAEHPAFTFDTLYEEGTWQVAAVLRTELGADELPYYAFFDAASRGEWQTWTDAILPKALYETGVVPHYGGQLLTLSTCGDSTAGSTARLAVVAVRGS